MNVIAWRAAVMILSALTVALGVGLAWLPGGVIVLGLEGFATVYAVAYLEGRK
jgi:hypothetical protein